MYYTSERNEYWQNWHADALLLPYQIFLLKKVLNSLLKLVVKVIFLWQLSFNKYPIHFTLNIYIFKYVFEITQIILLIYCKRGKNCIPKFTLQRQNLTQKHDSIIYFTNEKLFRTLTFFIEINKLQFVMFYYKQINYVSEEKNIN